VGRHAQNPRRLGRFGLMALAVVLGVGVWQGVAAATATSGKTVNIQHHNANCGRSIGTEPIGTATFSRDGNTLMVDINLTNADPNTDYFVELWTPKSKDCKFLDDMGKIETDSNGQAQDEFSSQVDPKKTKFFIDVTIGDCLDAPTAKPDCFVSRRGPGVNSFDNDSLIVKLNP